MRCVETLREHGHRITPQRMAILAAVQNSDDHISAEEVYSQVEAKYAGMNISTVYRTLDLLKELGLVTETDLGEGRLRYHFADKGHHHHLICQRCGQVFELEDSVLVPLKDILLQKYGFATDLRHLAVFGLCSKCR